MSAFETEAGPLSEELSPWHTRRLWSLWDMFTRLLIVRLASQLKSFRELEADVDLRLNVLELDRNDPPSAGITPVDPFATKEDKDDAAKIFIDFREHSEKFGLDRTQDRIKRFEALLKRTPVKLEDFRHQLRTLYEAIEDDLKQRFFFYLPRDKMDRYLKKNTVWNDVRKNFKSAIPAIDEAELCLAVGAANSGVYQAMMILERGLCRLATELNVAYGVDQWHVVIQNIEAAVKKLEELPRGGEKTETLTFYSRSALEFRYFKDAWRNHVAHARADYDEDQARSIVSHVHDFMTQLSSRLSEADEKEQPS